MSYTVEGERAEIAALREQVQQLRDEIEEIRNQ